MNSHAIRNAIAGALIVLFCAPSIMAAGKTKKIPAEGLTGIDVQLGSGEVQIMAWNGDHVTIEREKAPLKTIVEKGTLKISSAKVDGPIPVGYLKIFAPENINLSVTTKDGKVDIQGFSSRVQVVTINGGVRVSSCLAPVEVETVAGNIEALDLKGDVALKTVSGTIRGRSIRSAYLETKSVDGHQYLSKIEARRLRVRSHSGLIEIKAAVPKDGFWEGSTFESSIKISFKKESNLDLEAHSRFGQVRVNGNIEQKEQAGNYFRGRRGGGKTLVRLTTFNGNIDVKLKD